VTGKLLSIKRRLVAVDLSRRVRGSKGFRRLYRGATGTAGEPPRDKVETSWVIPATGPALNRGAHGRTYPPRGNAEIFGAYLVSSDFEVLA
jgi:hypothetical protein